MEVEGDTLESTVLSRDRSEKDSLFRAVGIFDPLTSSQSFSLAMAVVNKIIKTGITSQNGTPRHFSRNFDGLMHTCMPAFNGLRKTRLKIGTS